MLNALIVDWRESLEASQAGGVLFASALMMPMALWIGGHGSNTVAVAR